MWKDEKEKNIQEMKSTTLCVVGDGQWDSPGHNTKYCVYTMMDCVTEKIIHFEVVQRSSVAMEKYGFTTVMDRMISDGVHIGIVASDRHVGIRKKLCEDYSEIIQQFDVWHYAKSIKKKLTTASIKKFGKEIVPRIEKIILHFWWSIQTCDDNVESLTEHWLSLLKHITNQHEWEGKHYVKCSHGPLEDEECENKMWLNPENAPYTAIQKIVNGPKFLSDLKHLVHNYHTGNLEHFHSLALKYRTKLIHFGIDGMEARTKLAILTHNKNVGKEFATVKVQKKNTEEVGAKRTKLLFSKARKRWTVKNVYEQMNIDYLEDVSISVLKIAKGEQTHEWCTRAPSLPPNLENLERPQKELIKSQQLHCF